MKIPRKIIKIKNVKIDKNVKMIKNSLKIFKIKKIENNKIKI